MDWQSVGAENVVSIGSSGVGIEAEAGNTTTTRTGTVTYSGNTWYRFEGRIHFGTPGYTEVYSYDPSGSLLEHVIAFGVNIIPRYVMLLGSNSLPSAIDSLALSDQGWIGPAAVLPTQTSRKGAMFMDIMG
jgi:hypothetical protein